MNLQAGVRFPLAPELVTILQACGISISQLSYRATSVIMGLIVFFRERKSSLTPEILSRICRLIPDPQNRVSCRSKSLDFYVKDPPRNWTGRFFFVQNEWNIRERWGGMKDLPPSLHMGDEDVLRILGFSSFDDFQYEVRFIGKIVDEDRLFKAGISVQPGRSDALPLKMSKKMPSPAKKATTKVPLPPRSEEARSLAKRKAVVQTTAGPSSAAADPSSDSPTSRIPDHVLKRSCTGMLRTSELVTRKENLGLELRDALKEWNTEFVKTKFWLGEYKQGYQAKKKEIIDLEQQLSGCRAELVSLLSSFSAQDQEVVRARDEVVRARDEVVEVQLQANDMRKNYKALEAKVRRLEKEAEAGPRAVEDFKKSIAFKTIIQEHVEKEREHILDVEVKSLERRSYEEGFIRGFLKATRVVSRRTGAEIEGISPSQASEDPPSVMGDEVESVAESEDVDFE